MTTGPKTYLPFHDADLPFFTTRSLAWSSNQSIKFIGAFLSKIEISVAGSFQQQCSHWCWALMSLKGACFNSKHPGHFSIFQILLNIPSKLVFLNSIPVRFRFLILPLQWQMIFILLWRIIIDLIMSCCEISISWLDQLLQVGLRARSLQFLCSVLNGL